MESPKESGCQAPEGPILCINNCGFFGSATTQNMCSKCHKNMILNQQQVIEDIVTGGSSNNEKAPVFTENIVTEGSSCSEEAHVSAEEIVTGGSSSDEKAPVFIDATNTQAGSIELKEAPKESSSELLSGKNAETKAKAKEGPNRCTTCCKRVGLIGFKCKCGELYCSTHRYAEKHACTYDYKTAARDAIAKANPRVRAEKLDKI